MNIRLVEAFAKNLTIRLLSTKSAQSLKTGVEYENFQVRHDSRVESDTGVGLCNARYS